MNEEILINDTWVRFDPSLIEKRSYGNKFQLYYNNIKINRYCKIKFYCEKCGIEQISQYKNYITFKSKLCKVCKTNKTRLKKYGVENFFQLKEISQKAIENSHTEEAMGKQAETNIKKYGYKSMLSNQKLKEEKIVKKYGVKHPMLIESSKQKMKAHYQNKLKNKEYNEKVVNKRKETCMEKYGVEYAAQSEKSKEKSKFTCIGKYGVEYPVQNK